MNLAQQTTAELKRRLRFHENDCGTMTMEQECRRMYLIQEIDAELQRRSSFPHDTLTHDLANHSS